jgi:hypothetical protein
VRVALITNPDDAAPVPIAPYPTDPVPDVPTEDVSVEHVELCIGRSITRRCTSRKKKRISSNWPVSLDRKAGQRNKA